MKKHRSKTGKLIHNYTDYEIVSFYSENENIEKLIELTGIITENNKLMIQLNNYPKLKDNIDDILRYFELKNNCRLNHKELNLQWIIRELNKLLLETFDQNHLLDNFWKRYYIASS